MKYVYPAIFTAEDERIFRKFSRLRELLHAATT